MVSTWIESPARGRLGGPVRAGSWSTVVIGTHPVRFDERVWLELEVTRPVHPDERVGQELGVEQRSPVLLPAFFGKNQGDNSYWHVPIPPQAVGVRLHYRAVVQRDDLGQFLSHYQDTVVRPNLPDLSESEEIVGIPESVVGNRRMTVKIDARGSTYDIFYPSVGLHSDVRPAAGDQLHSRCNFQAILGGVSVGDRVDWFSERRRWVARQRYEGATNLLQTELTSRRGPVRVLITDFVVFREEDWPRRRNDSNESEAAQPGQYIKRFRITNTSDQRISSSFHVYVHAEVNGGIGEPGLSWIDSDQVLLAINRGHSHSNRKLARSATLEFGVLLDGRGQITCEPTAAQQAILSRVLDLPPGEETTVDLLVTGAFTGWQRDEGTYANWITPAAGWFRNLDLDLVEKRSAEGWDEFVDALPTIEVENKEAWSGQYRRSALYAALHCDGEYGGIASGFDRGLSAYCCPRDAFSLSDLFLRLGHATIPRKLLGYWLQQAVELHDKQYSYILQKYTINSVSEWETPAVDQTAMIPWCLDRLHQWTGSAEVVNLDQQLNEEKIWPLIQLAARVCAGESGHPGLGFVEDLHLISSANPWDRRYGAYLYNNTVVVAGLRAASRLADHFNQPEAAAWQALADRIWEYGILASTTPDGSRPGLYDPSLGRFLEGRRVAKRPDLWPNGPADWDDVFVRVSANMLALAVPYKLLPASDPRLVAVAQCLIEHLDDHRKLTGLSIPRSVPGTIPRRDKGVSANPNPNPNFNSDLPDSSCLATLWLARYLLQLGRETGKSKHWDRAIRLLQATLDRVTSLGTGLSPFRGTDPLGPNPMELDQGVWGLHTMLMECLHDLLGVSHDALGRKIVIAPILPSDCDFIGSSQKLPSGDVTYRLERLRGSESYRLTLDASLREAMRFEFCLLCPDLPRIDLWDSTSEGERGQFNPNNGHLRWSRQLTAGRSSHEWTWAGRTLPVVTPAV